MTPSLAFGSHLLKNRPVLKSTGRSTPRLAAGEQADIAISGQVAKSPAADVARATSWREHKLIFRSDRLEDVVAEVNRYSARPIQIGDTSARNLRISAIFDANDPEALLRFLQRLDTVKIEYGPDTIVIRAQESPAAAGGVTPAS